MTQQDVLQLEKDLERMKRELQMKNEFIEDLENELESVRLKVSKTAHAPVTKEVSDNGKLKAFQNEIAELKKEVATLMAEKKSANELIQILRMEIETQSDDKDLSTNSNVAHFEAELIRMSTELTEAKFEATRLAEMNEGLKNEISELKDEIEHRTEMNESLKRDIETTRAEHQELQNEVHALKSAGETKARGNSVFGEAMEAERRLEKEMKTIYKEKLALESLVKRQKRELEDAELRATLKNDGPLFHRHRQGIDMFVECERLRSQVHILEKEKFEFWRLLFAKIRGSSLKNLPSLIQAEIQAISIRMNALSSNYDARIKRSEKLEDENKALQNLRQDFEDKIGDLESTIEQQKKELFLMQKRMNRYIENGTIDKPEPSLGVGSIPKRAFPSMTNRPSLVPSTPLNKATPMRFSYSSKKSSAVKEPEKEVKLCRVERERLKAEEEKKLASSVMVIELNGSKREEPRTVKKSLFQPSNLAEKAKLITRPPLAEHKNE